MSIKPINNENHNDNIRPLTRLSKRKNSITSIPELKINNENDKENDKDFLREAGVDTTILLANIKLRGVNSCISI